MNAPEIFLLVFNVMVFIWVVFYRPWQASKRRDALMEKLHQEMMSTPEEKP